MPASQQQSGGGSQDNSLDFLWMIVLIVGGLALFWYFGQRYIIAVVLAVRTYEVALIEYVLRGYGVIAPYLHLPTPNTDDLMGIMNVINSKPTAMPLQQLTDLSNKVGRYYMIPVAGISVALALYTYMGNIAEKFKHVYNMDSLRKNEFKIWPQVTPVMKVDLVKKDLDQGPWSTSLTPMLFAKKNKLIVENRADNKQINVGVNEGACYRVFSLQVGQFWRNIESFPIHVQALYAIFLARANQDRAKADQLLKQIGSSATSEKLDFSGVKELVAKHKNSKYAQFAEQKHAYLLTVMATLLELARTDGVLATAEFLWLKPIDRPLWYMLNSVGRQTAFPEIAGVFAHWVAEKKLDRPLKVPMVEEAVKALEMAMKEIKYEPDEE